MNPGMPFIATGAGFVEFVAKLCFACEENGSNVHSLIFTRRVECDELIFVVTTIF
jgi:hypothetical protein